MSKLSLKLKTIKEKIYFFQGSLDDELDLLEEIADVFISYGEMFSNEMNDILNLKPEVNYIDLNDWMASLDIEKIDILFSSAILRYSFSMKDNLHCWNDLLSSVSKKCIEKNELYGLSKDDSGMI